MIGGAVGSTSNGSLIAEYSTTLAGSMLRQRTWFAESTARVESQLAGKVKSEFLSNMSHELRTPLNTVIGFAKLLGEHDRRQLKDAEIVEYAELIRDSATHLLAVINDILDISTIQSGTYTLDAREVHLQEVLQVAVASFKSHALELGVELKEDIAADLPAVKGDAGKLRKVFANLIGNALKFTPPAGSVTVEARVLDNAALVRVRDTGPGMSKEEISVALTPFAQVDASRSRWHEGTGLGLPIAKALVQLHGGRLEIRSAKSLGTEVVVRLPAAVVTAEMHGSTRHARHQPRSQALDDRRGVQSHVADAARAPAAPERAGRIDRSHRLRDGLQGHRLARRRPGQRRQVRPRLSPAPRDGHPLRHRHQQHGRARHRLGAQRAGPDAARRRGRAVDRRARPGR